MQFRAWGGGCSAGKFSTTCWHTGKGGGARHGKCSAMVRGTLLVGSFTEIGSLPGMGKDGIAGERMHC